MTLTDKYILLYLNEDMSNILSRYASVRLSANDENITVPLNKIFSVRGSSEEGSQFVVGQEVDVRYARLDNSWWKGKIVKLEDKKATVKFLSGQTETVNISFLREHLD